jgi:hypothetical protein
MVWLGLSIWMRIVAKADALAAQATPATEKSDGEKPKAPHPADFPQGGEKRPHIISLLSIWAPTKGPIWANHNNDA